MDDLDRLATLKEELLQDVNKIKEKTGLYRARRAEHKNAEQKLADMGLGQLGSPSVVFVRKFRWTLRSTVLREHYVKNVQFDFVKQVIRLNVMEVVCAEDDDINVQKWLEGDLSRDVLVFTTYDGCGTPLYQYAIDGLTLLEDRAGFDYAVSDESERSVGLGYTGLKRTYFSKAQPKVSTPKKGYRWRLKAQGYADLYDIDATGRPSVQIEETEINFLNAKTWIPGKASWETITVTYLDVAHAEMQSLWNWLATVYDFTDPVRLHQGERRDWNATAVLSMYDGCGVLLEGWTMQRVFPTAINFGDVDYSSSDIATIELTLRYSDVQYRSYCPNFQPQPCCGGCGTTTRQANLPSFN